MIDQAEIHRKAASGEVEERTEAVEQLRNNFADVPDKKEAWSNLIRLTGDEDSGVRSGAAYALVIAFQHVPDKEEAWRDLHRLVGDEDSGVRSGAADALRTAFQHVPDKEEVWRDLHRLVGDEDSGVRSGAAYALVIAFQHVPDKEEVWRDLHRLVGDEDRGVRSGAACALVTAFQHVPDKEEVWRDLHRLVGDEDRGVRSGAACALVTAFQHVPDKEEAWRDLIRLTEGENSYMRSDVADALGTAFQHVPDKEEAWRDLHRLVRDEDRNVRASANHSLGRASIFKATEAEGSDDFNSEVKNALEFFERSLKEGTDFNPSRFCLPFYRSFYSLTFEKAGAEGAVQRYLAEAKSASRGSKNKEILLEAVENLANALSEAHKATDFDAMKSDLNTYRRYCDRAADLIGDAAEGAPGAARILRRGLPIIGERIREIREKAEALCRETRCTGTPYEPLGMEVNKWAGELSDRDDPQNEQTVSRIIDTLIEFCNILPEGKRERPCRIVEEIREGGKLEDKLSGIDRALLYLQPSIESQLQNAAKPTTDKTESHGQPSQKTGHITTVFAESGSTVVVPHTETESGDVTVNTAVTKESQPDKQSDRSSKRTTIEISADIAVHVLVYTVLHHFAEDLMPVIAPILVLSALIILLLIIRNAKS